MSQYFSDTESDVLVRAISDLEQKTESEIRIHIEDTCELSPYTRAIVVFEKLEMYRTKNQTGVLIYLTTQDKKIAVIGDKGINEKLKPGYWDDIIFQMIAKFQTQGVYSGLLLGLNLIGEKLIEHFPEMGRPTNELSNEISYGKV